MEKKRKNNSGYLRAVIFLLAGLCFLSRMQTSVYAEEATNIFNREAYYDIYYEVRKFELDCIERVKVIGTVTIDGMTYLIIRRDAIKGVSEIKGKEGYILLSSVKAILPSDEIKLTKTSFKKE
jgi:hypothetical protein